MNRRIPTSHSGIGENVLINICLYSTFIHAFTIVTVIIGTMSIVSLTILHYSYHMEDQRLFDSVMFSDSEFTVSSTSYRWFMSIRHIPHRQRLL